MAAPAPAGSSSGRTALPGSAVCVGVAIPAIREVVFAGVGAAGGAAAQAGAEMAGPNAWLRTLCAPACSDGSAGGARHGGPRLKPGEDDDQQIAGGVDKLRGRAVFFEQAHHSARQLLECAFTPGSSAEDAAAGGIVRPPALPTVRLAAPEHLATRMATSSPDRWAGAKAISSLYVATAA